MAGGGRVAPRLIVEARCGRVAQTLVIDVRF